MASTVGNIVIPGDIVYVNLSTTCLLGPGLREKKEVVYATIPGVLRQNKCTYWVESRQKRYIPSEGDRILGVVTSKLGDNYRVDIGASDQAILSYLSFEGSTKRNRPDIKVGDLIYGRLAVGNDYFEPELVCIDSSGKSVGMGVLSGGFLLRSSVSLARRLLSENKVLKNLSNKLPYEITVGENGWIWVKGQGVPKTLALVRALTACEKEGTCNFKELFKTLNI